MSDARSFYRWRPHPWHGLTAGPNPPGLVHAYIEICPFDLVKYEVDKETGYLRVDRPQRTSSHHPTLYGFIPRTYCGERVGELMVGAARGDGDPLDICVLAEKFITRGDILLKVTPIGGIRMIDGGEADDKIIAVMRGDAIYGHMRDIHECPPAQIDRLKHYFLTYKDAPGARKRNAEITHVYGREEAHEVIGRSRQDYEEKFGELKALFEGLRTKE